MSNSNPDDTAAPCDNSSDFIVLLYQRTTGHSEPLRAGYTLLLFPACRKRRMNM